MTHVKRRWWLLLALVGATGSAYAQDPPANRPLDPAMTKKAPVYVATPSGGLRPADADKQVIRPISKDVLMVGRVRVDMAAGRVEAPATVLTSGVVEYFAVADRGKAYESVLLVDAAPMHLQVALLLIDLKAAEHEGPAGNATAGAPLPSKSATTWKGGDQVRLTVRYTDGGKTIEVPATSLMIDRKTRKAVADAPFLFTGSETQDAVLAADSNGALIALRPDPTALLNATAEYANPYAGSEGLMAGALPKTAKDVTLVITKTKK